MIVFKEFLEYRAGVWKIFGGKGLFNRVGDVLWHVKGGCAAHAANRVTQQVSGKFTNHLLSLLSIAVYTQ